MCFLFRAEGQTVYVSKFEIRGEGEKRKMLCDDMSCLGITLEDIEKNGIDVIDGQRELVVCCPKEVRTSVCDCPRASVSDIVMAYTGKKIGHHKTDFDHYRGHNVVHDTFGLLNAAFVIQEEGIVYTYDFISSYGKTETAIKNKNYASAFQGLFGGFKPSLKSIKDAVSESDIKKLRKVIKTSDSLATIERIVGKPNTKHVEREISPSLLKSVEVYGFINEHKEHEEAEDSVEEDKSDDESEW